MHKEFVYRVLFAQEVCLEYFLRKKVVAIELRWRSNIMMCSKIKHQNNKTKVECEYTYLIEFKFLFKNHSYF